MAKSALEWFAGAKAMNVNASQIWLLSDRREQRWKQLNRSGGSFGIADARGAGFKVCDAD